MEKITINEITKKDSGLVIVKYIREGMNPAGVPNEATLNTKWQGQEVDYLEKDVGIGGSVNVLIVKKGEWTNITKVDMTSAVKGNIKVDNLNNEPLTSPPASPLLSQKDISIIAQVMTKCVCYNKNDVTIGSALDMYHEACLALEQNG